MLVEVYDDTAPDKSRREWFRCFKDGDFSIEDNPRSGQPKKFENKALEEIIRRRSEKNSRGVCRIIGDNSTSRFYTRAMGMIQKQGNWMPYELKPRDVER